MSYLDPTAGALYRWLFTAVVGLAAAIGLAQLEFNIPISTIFFALKLAAVLYGGAVIFQFLGKWTNSFVFTGSANFFFSTAQLWIYLCFAAGLQYVAAAANFPLVDNLFLRADSVLGFDWNKYSDWATQPGMISELFKMAYSSFYLQMIAVMLVHCMRPNDDGNAEFISCYMITLLMILAISVVAPAKGYPGLIGQNHIDVFYEARNGAVNDISGIITFPSLHAAMGTLYIYTVRKIEPLLAILVPLNLLLILSTPPCGGHYLVDTIAGVLVAVAAVCISRRINLGKRSAKLELRELMPGQTQLNAT